MKRSPLRRSELKRKPRPTAVFRCVTCGALFKRRADHFAWQRTQEPPARLVGAADNSGKRNGRYRNGKRVGEHINQPKVRALVIERDGNWCLLCGRPPKGLHLHRVRYGSEGGKYEVDNCVQLCGEHHAFVHSSKRTWQPRLLAYIADPSDRSPLAEFRDAREEAS